MSSLKYITKIPKEEILNFINTTEPSRKKRDKIIIWDSPDPLNMYITVYHKTKDSYDLSTKFVLTDYTIANIGLTSLDYSLNGSYRVYLAQKFGQKYIDDLRKFLEEETRAEISELENSIKR